MKLERSFTALVLAGVLVLSGCGEDKDSGAKVGDSATTSSSAADDATQTPSEDASVDSSAGEVVDKADFLADMRQGIDKLTTAHVIMDADSPGGAMKGEGDLDMRGDELAMAMTMSIPAMGADEVEVRLVDGFMYMKMPGRTGDKFIKLDLSDPNGPLAGLGQLTDAFDPTKSFDLFSDGVTKVVFLGEDDLDGEQFDHYELTVDTTKVDAFKGLPGASNIPKSLTYEIWVDDQFRMRGMDMDLPTGRTTVRYTDIGEPVEVKAPPASQVTTMPGM